MRANVGSAKGEKPLCLYLVRRMLWDYKLFYPIIQIDEKVVFMNGLNIWCLFFYFDLL